MRKIQLVVAFLVMSSVALAQEPVEKEKKFTQEIGFNTVTLLSQIILFTPKVTDQLPFDVFYNLYYHDTIGMRLGLGVLTNITQTTIDGQNTPRTTTTNNLNARIGISYNFIRTKRLALNAFGDYLHKNVTNETITTTTVQNHPNPIIVQTVESIEAVKGYGGQVGVGIKYTFNKHLGLYLELPISFMYEVKNITDVLKETGMSDLTTRSTVQSNGTRISLPSTIYLVLRF